jgi:hypothetical protein
MEETNLEDINVELLEMQLQKVFYKFLVLGMNVHVFESGFRTWSERDAISIYKVLDSCLPEWRAEKFHHTVENPLSVAHGLFSDKPLSTTQMIGKEKLNVQ